MNIQELIQYIELNIKANGVRSITGTVLQQILVEICENIPPSEVSKFLKISDPTPVEDGIYLALESGTYPNGITVDLTDGITYLVLNQEVWSKIVYPVNLVVDGEVEVGDFKAVSGDKVYAAIVNSVNGVVEEGNTKAVSGGEVYDSITLLYLDKNVVFGGIDAVTGAFVTSENRARIEEIMILPENYKFDIEVVSGNLCIRNIVLYDENNVRLAGIRDGFEEAEIKKYVSSTVNPDYKKIGVSFWKFGSSEPITEQEILDTKIKISLGDRTSISQIKGEIDELNLKNLKNLNTRLEYGGIRDTNGELADNFLRLRNADFIPVRNGATINISSNNADFYPNAVNKYLNGVFVEGTTQNTPFVVDSTFNQIKVSWRKTDNSRITYEENRDLEIFITDNVTTGNSELPNNLIGKILHVIGSSNVTDAYGRWAQDLSIDKKMLLTYSAVAGAQIAKKPSFAYPSSVEQLEDYILTEVKPDILMLSSGLNDSFRPPITPLGDWDVVKTTDIATIRATDTNTTYGINTFYGALKYIAEKMIAEFPDTRIVFNVPFQCWKGRADGFDLYAQAIRDVAKLYSITIIDSWAEGGFNRITEFEGEVGRYTIDGIHTVLNNVINDKGRKVQARFMTNEFHKKIF